MVYSPHTRKAQLTLFIILGMFLIIGAAFVIYYTSGKADQQNPGASTLEQTQSKDLIDLTISSCLEYVGKNAIAQYGVKPGLSEAFINRYVTTNMPICTDNFRRFENQGFSVKIGGMTPRTQITEDVVSVDLNYPVEFRKDNLQITVSKYTFLFHNKIQKDILPGVETTIVSDDQRTQFIIPADTEITVNGNPITRVSMELLDREYDSHSNKVMAGMLAFRGLPDGAQFSKPITIIHHYKQYDIPSTVDEADLKLAFFSQELGVWISMPTTVDTENDILISHTSHFTEFAAVLRCSEKTDLTEFTSPVLVQQDCNACEGWTNGNPPSADVGPLWILSDAIKQGDKIGTVPECKKTSADKSVTTCADCKGTCSGTQCTETYFSYDKVDIEGTNALGSTKFAKGGDACIWAKAGGTDPKPKTAIQDTTNPDPGTDWDVLIRAFCPDTTDQCVIPENSFTDSTLKFTLKVTNGDAPNSCIKGKVISRYNGFGIIKDGQDSYYVCDKEGEEAQVPVIGGEIDEVILSVCTKNENGGFKWVAKPGAEIKTDLSKGGAGDRRGRDKCPEGDASPPAEPYPSCPEDYDQNFKGKEFTVDKCIDTRNKDFCDWYGDFPAMQYTDNMKLDPGTKLKVFGSAYRNGRCWLLVEAQQKLAALNEKPDFYVKLDQVKDYILNGTTGTFDGSVCMSGSSSQSSTTDTSGGNVPSASVCGKSDGARGIDVSHYQGAINWAEVKSSGISFAFIKATEADDYKDDTFKANWQGAKAAGVLRGAYHFMRPIDGKIQAQNFLDMLGSDYGELPPVLDLEAGGVTPQQLMDFLKAVESKTGRKPLIYTSPGYWSGFQDIGFGSYPVWIANWGVNCPTVPGTWKKWDFWQDCGDCQNTLKGVSGKLDYDYFNGNVQDLQSYAYK